MEQKAEAHAFDYWAASAQLYNTQPLLEIGHPTEGPIIGIDAAHFLESWYYPRREPLVSALGGFPLAFEDHIFRALKAFEDAGVNLTFIFDGLDTAFDEGTLDTSIKASADNAVAFRIYDKLRDDKQAVEHFKSSVFPDTKWLSEALRIALNKYGADYYVAPFKAHAQLAHMLKEGHIDAVYGSTELFLYGVPKIITRILLIEETVDDEESGNTKAKFNLEQSTITWIELDSSLKMLGDVSFELFQNAFFLSGTRGLARFPALRELYDAEGHLPFREVVSLLSQYSGNIIQLCERYPAGIKGDWLKKYMKAHQAITHMVILFDAKTLKPRTYQNEKREDRPPTNLHELVGLQLPAELHLYLYHGMIGSRMLNWLVSGKIKLPAPLAGGDSDAYRNLLRDNLDPWRKQALSMVAFTLNRYWQRKEFSVQTWFGGQTSEFKMKDLVSPKKTISAWRVQASTTEERVKVLQKKHKGIGLGSLYFALASLEDASFVSKTFSPVQRSGSNAQLDSVEEIVVNTFWRLLQLRGYISDKHQLTEWGRLLLVALEKVADKKEESEAIFLAVELLRLGILEKTLIVNKDSNASPKHGNDVDKSHNLLVSHIACTGKLVHGQLGYMGPLSVQLLAFHAVITEVRLALRDLIDSILITMFLEDEVERYRADVNDYKQISAALPFVQHNSAALGVLTSLYLDELTATDNPVDTATKARILQTSQDSWFKQSNVSGSLKLSYSLWDSITSAVNTAPPSLISAEQKTKWKQTDEWFQARSPF